MMAESDCQPLPPGADTAGAEAGPIASGGRRLRALVDAHYDFVWRTLRYLGMTEANAADGAQRVMCVLARRLDEVEEGAEAAFLVSTAMRIASEDRRAARRRPAGCDTDVDALATAMPSSEELLDERRAHAVLRQVLEAIPVDLRIVFVLFEIEELAMPEIAQMLGIPTGTVASRLRRARESFRATVRRMRAANGPLGDRR